MRYIHFIINEEHFEISEGGNVYEKAIGSDSYSCPGWYVSNHGCYERGMDLCSLEDGILEFINLGAKISIVDASEDIDYVCEYDNDYNPMYYDNDC